MSAESRGSASEVFWIFLRLGMTSFGGPVAHLAYFHRQFVVRDCWLNEQEYSEGLALCQALPGPASSQLAMWIGLRRAGRAGVISAWFGFTLPSFLIMLLFGWGLFSLPTQFVVIATKFLGWLTAAIVAQALLRLGTKLAAGPLRASLALFSFLIASQFPTAGMQPLILVVCALLGAGLIKAKNSFASEESIRPSSRGARAFLLVIFAGLLALSLSDQQAGVAGLAASFYRTGSLVFGGGHVVLPLLKSEFVQTGAIPESNFLAGYGAAQLLPGPLFTFATFLGWQIAGLVGAMVATVAIFLPSLLLISAGGISRELRRRHPRISAALAGVAAGAVGLLMAAFCDPVWSHAVHGPVDFTIVLLFFAGLIALEKRTP